MAQQIPAEAIRDGAPLVELGGGTGSITQGLIEAGMPPKRLIVVERDPTLARLLRARFPSVLVACGDAARLPELLAAYGVSRAASIVSGLPLLLFPEEVLSRLVAGCFALLGPSRPLIQFTYGMGMPLPAGEHGLQARRRAWVFRNLPPAFVWTFTR
jgi:phosphatidylethanolamine/phosphatidyl-N-methylethanolamine N-methyltransferase